VVDRETLQRRLGILLDALADLRRYRDRFDADKLVADRDAQHMVLHALYIAAQAAIDLALHGSAAAEQPMAATYQQAFERLAATNMLEAGLARRLMGWAGLRNVLAHQYATVDYRRIAATLANELPHLEQFAVVVSAWG
jgi:uncharacterized protein YutE (UPF0331/DUF86 family)